jgi:nucleoside-diphosphate-sugar epimerase
MQTILGSGGGIGVPLARELKNYTDDIRLVSRNPVRVNATDQLFPADLTDAGQIEKVIAGSEVAYVTVGFEYSIKVWRNIWPSFMHAVIESCKKHQTKLVFFDNVYMYARSAIPHMTEEARMDPPSKKGAVRKQLNDMIMEEVEQNNLTALIARSADFYGPETKNSVLSIMVAENLMKGKKAQVFGDIDRIHTYTYTPDAAQATARLGNTSDAYNQVWHVPTTKEKLTTRQWIQMIADELQVDPKIQTVPAWMLHILGIFIPVMKEFPEMLYQSEQDYVFDSGKFENRFGILATDPADGIKKHMQYLKKQQAP